MNSAAKPGPGRRKRPTSILGLRLESGRLEAAHVVRANGAVRIARTLSVPLEAPVHPAPSEALAAEIRRHLEAAGIKERHCVVAVPDRWILTARTEIPPLPEADAEGLLQIEAENGFSTDAASLRLGNSRCTLPSGGQHVTLFGVAGGPLSELEAVLSKAGLRTDSLTLGTPVLVPARAGGLLFLSLDGDQVVLLVQAGGGIAAYRTLEGPAAEDGTRTPPSPELVAREIRITLGQLPEALRREVVAARVTGPAAAALDFADRISGRLQAQGLRLAAVSAFDDGEPVPGIPSGTPLSVSVGLAARRLEGAAPACEFLPPRPTLVGRLVARYSAGRLKTAGAVAAGVVALLVAAFLYQQVQLLLLQRRWNAMSGKVAELETMQSRIRQYRPWFDESFPNLAAIRQLSASFPQDGSVTATAIEVREGNVVTCSGNARDTAALLRMLDTLGSAPGVSQLHRDQIRGASPIQFTFGFQWNPGGTP